MNIKDLAIGFVLILFCVIGIYAGYMLRKERLEQDKTK